MGMTSIRIGGGLFKEYFLSYMDCFPSDPIRYSTVKKQLFVSFSHRIKREMSLGLL